MSEDKDFLSQAAENIGHLSDIARQAAAPAQGVTERELLAYQERIKLQAEMIERWGAEREAVARAVFGEGWKCCANLGPYVQSIVSELNELRATPAEGHPDSEAANWARLGASDYACHRWPEDTAEHRAMRAAFMDGAAHAVSAQPQSPAESGHQPIGECVPRSNPMICRRYYPGNSACTSFGGRALCLSQPGSSGK